MPGNIVLPHSMYAIHPLECTPTLKYNQQGLETCLELHVGGTGGLRAGSADVLAEVAPGDELLRHADVVVGEEVHPQVLVCLLVLVHLHAARCSQTAQANIDGNAQL